MIEKSGPCLEKNCSWCCNPVKVHRDFPKEKIPIDEKGNPIWIETDEILAPESSPDSIKLKSFRCTKLDEQSGRCLEYEKRPDICRVSGCIDENSKENPETQFKKMSGEKFIKIKLKK